MTTHSDSETAGKIILQEDVKLFRVKGVVAILDTPFYDYTKAKINLHNPTPVKDFSTKKIGFANVFVENDKLIADVVLDYYTPERFDIDVKNDVYLGVNGFLVLEEEKLKRLDLYGITKKVLQISILSLVLTHRKPTDTRISPLGEIVLV